MLKKQLGELLFFKDILKVGDFSSEVELLISTHKTVGSLLSSGKEKSKEIFLQHTLSYLAIPPHLKTLAMDNKKEVDKRLYTWISAVTRKVWGGEVGGVFMCARSQRQMFSSAASTLTEPGACDSDRWQWPVSSRNPPVSVCSQCWGCRCVLL